MPVGVQTHHLDIVTAALHANGMPVHTSPSLFESDQIEHGLKLFAAVVAPLLLALGLLTGNRVLAQSHSANERTNAVPTNQVWAATSQTAVSITGNIVVTPQAITISHKEFPLEFVRQVDKQHFKDVARIIEPFMQHMFMQPLSARLYKTLISRDVQLLNGNTMCGPNAAKWMLAAYSEDHLSLAFFSSAEEPNLDYKVVETSHDLCGTFTYIDPKKMPPLTAGDGSVRP